MFSYVSLGKRVLIYWQFSCNKNIVDKKSTILFSYIIKLKNFLAFPWFLSKFPKKLKIKKFTDEIFFKIPGPIGSAVLTLIEQTDNRSPNKLKIYRHTSFLAIVLNEKILINVCFNLFNSRILLVWWKLWSSKSQPCSTVLHTFLSIAPTLLHCASYLSLNSPNLAPLCFISFSQ